MGERHKALWDIAMRETGERKKESGKERRRDTGGRNGRHRDGEWDMGDGTRETGHGRRDLGARRLETGHKRQETENWTQRQET